MAMKRANGSGTVYKLKHKKLRKPYRAVITIGWTEDGKPIKKSLGTFATQSEAHQALSTYATNPDAFEERKITTFGQVFDWTLEESKRQGLSKGRIQSIDIARRHFSHLLQLDVSTIRAIHVQSFFDDNDFTYSYQKNTKSILIRVMNVAIKHEIITKNYMNDIIISKNARETRKANVFTLSNINTLWQHQNEQIARFLLIFIYTGLRISELFALQTKNVHLKDRYMIGGSKTDAGRDRAIPIAECIYPFIEELYTTAKFKRSEKLVTSWAKHRYRDEFTRACEEWQLGSHVPHDTRHTFITLCSNADIPEILVKHIVGHSTAKDITQSIYTHKTVSQYVDAVNKLPIPINLEKGEPQVSYR